MEAFAPYHVFFSLYWVTGSQDIGGIGENYFFRASCFCIVVSLVYGGLSNFFQECVRWLLDKRRIFFVKRTVFLCFDIHLSKGSYTSETLHLRAKHPSSNCKTGSVRPCLTEMKKIRKRFDLFFKAYK